MRYERKYRIEGMDLHEVLEIVRAHPFMFTQEYPQRKVNNIYLDSQNLDALRDKLNGVPNRAKFRIRWYGEDSFEARSPQVETKIRSGALGEKLTRHVPSFKFGSVEQLKNYVREIIQPDHNLEPVLFNSFRRHYYISADKMFRVTVDTQLEFRSIMPGYFSKLNYYKDTAIILEVKYDEAHEEFWPDVAVSFPFQTGKNSKYVTGMVLTGRGIEGNDEF